MKKIKKSTAIPLALFVYISVTAAYLLPKNGEVSLTEKIVTLGAGYVIVFLLWLVLRKKEEILRKKDLLRKEDILREKDHLSEEDEFLRKDDILRENDQEKH